jgi:hypothetical protein
MGRWGPLLLCVVCVACGSAGVGFWRRRRWGYQLGIGLLVVNLVGMVLPLETLKGPVELPRLFVRFIGVAETLGAIGLILP